jgi:hypothetical protein
MQWTRVSDELPRTHQQVIAWAEKGENLMQETVFNGRDFVYGFHNNRMGGVTHWMAFPEPPNDLPVCTCYTPDARKACRVICSEVPF